MALMAGIPEEDVDYLIELRGVYDGWSIAVHKDGSMHNRWADEDGNPVVGRQRQWLATQNAIESKAQVSI